MPAHKKHLTKSFHQRFAKITAGFLGGYAVTVSLFMALSLWWDRAGVMVTLIFGGFILWAGLMIVAFLFRNGWLAWLLYLVLATVFSAVFYFNQYTLPL
ncbi:hypothetical protein [Marinoscillum sp. 108]|uniref:hypothetical protein n=1 Tax=Marinoscillum sp. 108 TaxID=2653151 RepID=UPI0012F3B550|nr:hypothetical protein [Marinoscillum sp. 108]VXD17492.1 conserved membrane hypothetical protein [Marinoscillum sp. 108]